MQREFGSWSRTLIAIGLAIGISFSASTATVTYADDADDSRDYKAYLYEGTVADLDGTGEVNDIDDVDDDQDRDDLDSNKRDDNRNQVDRDDDDWDDDDWDDDDWDDDDWDDDDWDDDDWDDDDWDDDDWDDFGNSTLIRNGNNDSFRLHAQHADDTVDSDLWNKIGNGEERPEGLFSTQGKIDDDHGLTVANLANGEYMIVIHEEDDTDSAILAAGNIEGVMIDGAILIDLQEIDGSGFEGRTLIQPNDEDANDDLLVTVGLFSKGAVAPLNAESSRED